MMDINYAMRILADEIGGEDLHVTREYDQIDFQRGKQFQFALFRFGFIFFRYRNYLQWDAIKIYQSLHIRMIADDQWDFAGEFAAAMAVEQIGEAVIVL